MNLQKTHNKASQRDVKTAERFRRPCLRRYILSSNYRRVTENRLHYQYYEHCK